MKNFATDMPQVYQIVVEKVEGKDCSHNKEQICPFCPEVGFKNFAKHLTDLHKDEPEVLAFTCYPLKSAARGARISLLRIRGNHSQNIATLKAKEGMFIPCKRSTSKWNVSDFVACPLCNMWLKGHLLWKHQKNCISRELSPLTPRIPLQVLVVQAEIIAGRISLDASEELRKEVYTNMRNDEISKVARADPLIACLGNLSMKRNIANKAMRRYNVSGVMRLAARLLIELRSLQDSEDQQKKLTFYDALVPDQYNKFVQAVFHVCREEVLEGLAVGDEEESLEAPSNAIKLSYDIQKLCYIKQTKAIDFPDKVKGEQDRKLVKRFLEKFTIHWGNDVKKRARHVLRDRKLNTTVQLPDPEDIAKLADYMQDLMKSTEKPTTPSDFKQLQNYVLARLISFNRRRPGEVQVLK